MLRVYGIQLGRGGLSFGEVIPIRRTLNGILAFGEMDLCRFDGAALPSMHEFGYGRVSRVSPVHTAIRNCTRDEGGPFEVGNQVLISSHRKLLLSKAMVVSVAETAGRDPVRQG